MSAQLVLAGMYPVKHGCLCTDGNNEDYEYEELHYQPVPVHVLTGDGSNRLVICLLSLNYFGNYFKADESCLVS